MIEQTLIPSGYSSSGTESISFNVDMYGHEGSIVTTNNTYLDTSMNLITVMNTSDNVAYFQAKKLGPVGEAIAGAQFRLIKLSSLTTSTSTTNLNGYTGSIPVEPNSEYILKEYFVPNPYQIDSTPIFISVDVDKSITVHSSMNIKFEKSYGIPTVTMFNKRAGLRVKVRKLDAITGVSLEGSIICLSEENDPSVFSNPHKHTQMD